MKDPGVIEIIESKGQMHVITWIAMFKDELVKENIITSMQSAQISQYIQEQLQKTRMLKAVKTLDKKLIKKP